MTSQQQQQQKQILDLKRRAIELKKAGDINGAKLILGQIREIEYENVSIDDLKDPISLKKFAIVLKNKGDLQGANKALVKAKSLQQQQDQPQQNDTAAASASSSSSAARDDQQQKSSQENERIQQQQKQQQQQQQQQSNNVSKDADDNVDVSFLLEQDEDVDGAVTFTDEEMLDVEMMCEFKTCGMDVPSDEAYKTKIMECKKAALSYKQKGDLTRAKTELLRAKQFNHAMTTLSQIEGDLMNGDDMDDEAWLKELNEEDGDLMRELTSAMNNNNSSDDNINGLLGDDNIDGEDAMMLELDDLEDMDEEMLQDVINEGLMKVPNVNDIVQQAKEKKALALELKQKGMTSGALAALAESKKLQASANKLDKMLKAIKSHNDDDDNNNVGCSTMEDLEAMLENNGNGGSSVVTKKTKKSPTSIDNNVPATTTTKSSEELKKEAIRLRTENNMTEATKVFKLYKETLAKEAKVKRLEQQRKAVSDIRNEINTTITEQIRLFQFYERFCSDDNNDDDAAADDGFVLIGGSEQLKLWQEYKKQCMNCIKLIEEKDATVIVSRQQQQNNTKMKVGDTTMMQIHVDNDDGIIDFVDGGANQSDDRLEISILQILLDIHKNKALQKILKQASGNGDTTAPPNIKVEVVIQIPPSENDADKDKSISLIFEPTLTEAMEDTTNTTTTDDDADSNNKTISYEFDSSTIQHVDIPRGKNKYGKMVIRRMSWKKMQIIIHRAPPKTKKKSSWFGGSKKEDNDNNDEPTILGKVVFELSDLLKRNCIAGDYPLLDKGGRKEVGGIIRLGIRTGVPFQKQEEEKGNNSAGKADIRPYQPLTFNVAAGQKSEDVS